MRGFDYELFYLENDINKLRNNNKISSCSFNFFCPAAVPSGIKNRGQPFNNLKPYGVVYHLYLFKTFQITTQYLFSTHSIHVCPPTRANHSTTIHRMVPEWLFVTPADH